MQMNLKDLSYWGDIYKLKFNIERNKVLHIESKNIKVEYKLSNREMKKMNEERDLRVGFDDTFKTDIDREAIVLKIYETLMRSRREYCAPTWASVLRHGNWRGIVRLEGIQKIVTNLKKKNV